MSFRASTERDYQVFIQKLKLFFKATLYFKKKTIIDCRSKQSTIFPISEAYSKLLCGTLYGLIKYNMKTISLST